MTTTQTLLGVALLLSAALLAPVQASAAEGALTIRSFRCDKSLTRVGRTMQLLAAVENAGATALEGTATVSLPEGISFAGSAAAQPLRIAPGAVAEVVWTITAQAAVAAPVTLTVQAGELTLKQPPLLVRFLGAIGPVTPGYPPAPQPVKTEVLVGAHNCPLWENDRPEMWSNILKHPERTPVLGFYDQANPEVADWETLWAAEHGVNFFIYCWYRAGQGVPVKMNFGSAIHEALYKSRYAANMKFTIMWENQGRGTAGVADEQDLMSNLLPFWIENYFKHPSYLKIDNKPVLFIYRPEFLIDDLKGEANVVRAFDLMREACRKAGFDGLYLLGEYRGLDRKHLELMKRIGLDYTFAYCWHVPGSPAPQQAIDAQLDYIRKTQELGVLPQVVTVSQAWSGWADEGSIWKIPPQDFARLLKQAKDFIATFPAAELGSKLLLLDNWNEWGEGHYLAPYREYGFGYLDAVREVFSKAPEPHRDLIPEDLGRGPFDTWYWEGQREAERLARLAAQRVTKPGAETPGLVAWWTFDDEAGAPVALDYSGHGLGGGLHDVTRVAGRSGQALDCQGGVIIVPPSPLLSPTALTIECWVKTETTGQGNNWIVNKVFGGCEDTGFRLGLLADKPCFEVPQTRWSHHLTAETTLPLGRWVHLAGTFDGQVMRLYVDGKQVAAMDRPGPAKPNSHYLCLGNYELKHQAYFRGLVDEVRLYDRALSAEEIAARADGR